MHLAALLSIASFASIQAFDFYVLSQTFQPYFCTTGNFAGCNNPTDFMKTNLTIHGLWPNNNDGSYPSFCSDETLSQSTIDQVGMDVINTYWPDVKTNYGTTFISNEWSKHGTCSDMAQLDYVNAAISLETQLGTPDIISSNVGSSAVGSQIRAGYGGANMVALVCGSNGALSEVRTCYENTGSGPGNRITCPQTILNEDSCAKKAGKKITIYSFNDN
ncbi:hypothetical protein THRCLA_22088 [Thraustotheca clavata]|uniref:Secreted protein n=1 Tax=Thraustotheca clavata TaxID=74557 RepID=A0A1V9ZCE6_9STRA|nr:hypothetical protein THRCLA_22088 [Thraustotheca clavata]